jgi:hypothetical protein
VHLNFCLVSALILLSFGTFYGIEILAGRMGVWTKFVDDAWLTQRDTSIRFWMMTFGVIIAAMIFLKTGTSTGTIWSLFVLVLCYYMAAVDLRDFWLPDHATLTFLLIGLMWSPFEPNPLNRIHGLVIAAVFFSFIGLLVNFIRYRRIAWDNFSGGDMIMGAGIGAWFGVGPTAIILMIALCLGLFSNIIRRLRLYLVEVNGIAQIDTAGDIAPDGNHMDAISAEMAELMTSRHVPEPLGVSMAGAVAIWLVVGFQIQHALYMYGLMPIF